MTTPTGSEWITAQQAATCASARRGRYAPAEDDYVLQLADSGASILTIALRVHRTWHSVQKRLRKLRQAAIRGT